MMGLYHNYPNIVELFLEIYCEAAKRMLCYLTTSASRHLYQQTINLIQVYAHHNQVMVYLYTVLLKFRYCEKAKKFEKISHLILFLLSNVKTTWQIFFKCDVLAIALLRIKILPSFLPLRQNLEKKNLDKQINPFHIEIT